ncbi:MAG: YncE family protein, partial [candidate division WOR-3 bacterium]
MDPKKVAAAMGIDIGPGGVGRPGGVPGEEGRDGSSAEAPDTVTPGQWLEATITLPDSLGGLVVPTAMVRNETDDKLYVVGNSDSVLVISGLTFKRVARVRVGADVRSLIWVPEHNWVCCASTGDGAVTILDGSEDRLIAQVRVGDHPCALVYNSASDRLFVANALSNSISIIDCQSFAVETTVTVRTFPNALAYNSQENKIYCANRSSNDVTILDGRTYRVLATVPVGLQPGALAYNPLMSKIYCAGFGSNTVTIIDGITNLIRTVLPTGAGPSALAYNSTGNRIYCANSNGAPGAGVTVISGITDEVVRVLPVYATRAIAYSPGSNRIYCMSHNFVSGLLTLFDGVTDQLVGEVGGLDPSISVLACDPGRSRVYGLNPNGNRVDVIDCARLEWNTAILTAAMAYRLEYNLHDNKVYAVCTETDQLPVLDATALRVQGSLRSVHPGPWALTYNSQNNKVYVGNGNRSGISVLDGAGDTLLGVITGSDVYAGDMCYNPIVNRVYYAAWGADYVGVIDGASDQVVARISVGPRPTTLARDTVHHKVFCCSADNDDVTAIDGQAYRVLGTARVGSDPCALLYEPWSNRLFVADRGSDDITVIDGVTNQVALTLPAGRGPSALAYNPANQKLYAANELDNSVTIIDAASYELRAVVQVGPGPCALHYNSVNNLIYCTCRGGNSVAVIDGSGDSLVETIPVGEQPCALVWDQSRNRTFVACAASSRIWVLRDSIIDAADVGVRCITAPGMAVDSGMALVPACSVFNYQRDCVDYQVRMRIGNYYNETAAVTGHRPWTSVYVTFPLWTATELGALPVTCSTELSRDGRNENDRRIAEVLVKQPLAHDVGCLALVAPGAMLDSGQVVVPACSVRNFGSNVESYQVRLSIGSDYCESVLVTLHEPFTSRYVTVPASGPRVRGSQPVVCSTELSSDLRAA